MDTFGVAAGPVDRYIAALYWSMMTVTGIGYGEMLPINTTERAFCTLWMLIAGAVWTYIIGTVALIATTLDPNGVSFHNTMDSLNCFMRERELPRHMRMMLRDYFTSARRVHQLNDDFKIISMMSPMLEGEVAVATNRRWLQRVWCGSAAALPMQPSAICALRCCADCLGRSPHSAHFVCTQRSLS